MMESYFKVTRVPHKVRTVSSYVLRSSVVLMCLVLAAVSIRAQNITEKEYLCPNEFLLLYNSASNWEIDLDSLGNQKRFSEESRERLKGQYPKEIIPFTVFLPQEIDVAVDKPLPFSFAALKYPTGRGWVRDTSEIFKISVFESEDIRVNYSPIKKDDLNDLLYKFFEDKRTLNQGEHQIELQGLEIWLNFNRESLGDYYWIFDSIIKAYLKAQATEAERRFDKDICDLSNSQLDSLKDDLPLKVAFMRGSGN